MDGQYFGQLLHQRDAIVQNVHVQTGTVVEKIAEVEYDVSGTFVLLNVRYEKIVEVLLRNVVQPIVLGHLVRAQMGIAN